MADRRFFENAGPLKLAALAEIAEVLGHRTLHMVKRYAHLSDSHVAGVLESMNRRVFGHE